MFFDFGVKHVVCVKTENNSNSLAALHFTRAFYKLLFQGRIICHAFEHAKNEAETKYDVKDLCMFQLIKDERLHSCYSIEFSNGGQFKSVSDHSLIKEMQSNKRQSICRETELFELNTKILHMQTPVTFLFGEPGVGKSHLLRDACTFMQ